MSNKPNDGGPAFPKLAYMAAPDGSGDSIAVYADDGMTLRDYFAAKAMEGAIAHGALERIAKGVTGQNTDMTLYGAAKVTNRLLAEMMFEIADAMLKAREEESK